MIALSYNFRFNDQTKDQMFDVFLRQISTDVEEIPESVRAIYTEYEATFGYQRPSSHLLSTMLLEVLSKVDRVVYMVIDAVDECLHGARETLFTVLRDFSTQTAVDIRVLVSSRKEPDIISIMKDLQPQRLDLSPTVNSDITIFIEHELQGFTQSNAMSAEQKTALIQRIEVDSKGMSVATTYSFCI